MRSAERKGFGISGRENDNDLLFFCVVHLYTEKMNFALERRPL